MTEFKKFSRGKHTYVKFGHNFKEVRVEGQGKEGGPLRPEQTQLDVDVDAVTAQGVYGNLSMVHQSEDELVLDFIFLPPGQKRGRVRSRVILPYKNAAQLAALLKKACEGK